MKSAGFHVFAKWAKDQWSYFVFPLDPCSYNIVRGIMDKETRMCEGDVGSFKLNSWDLYK